MLQAKQEVLRHLTQIPLANRVIKAKLEKILSVPEPSIFEKLKEYLGTEKQYLSIDHEHPERTSRVSGLSFFKVLLKFTGCIFAIFSFSCLALWPCGAPVLFSLLCSLYVLSSLVIPLSVIMVPILLIQKKLKPIMN